MTRILFGTDGVRGVAGEKLTAELALRLGRAATQLSSNDRPRVLIIRDTRESGEMLEAALAAGITSAGGDAELGGVAPTPAAALAVLREGYDLAVVISASHNPYADNGIKFFGPDGDKLTDEQEAAIEAAIDEPAGPVTRFGGISTASDTLARYLGALAVRFTELDLRGMRVLLDCSHGATSQAAPAIFRDLGATVDVLADAPDGRNINEACGSTHPELLRTVMVEGDYDIGFAFDGDGDRLLAVDRTGRVADGDELLALAALHLRDRGELPGGGIAATVMSNYGLHVAMREAGIEVASTAVGDRYVLQALRERGFALGGEQSGHMIELGFAPSGDGIASALLTLEALAGRDLADTRVIEKLPQKLVNVRVDGPAKVVAASDVVRDAVARESGRLDGRGRVLVRPSGTEPLIRVMAEAPDHEEADDVVRRLADAVALAA
jgi:phosphoglucosamine mutase